MKLTTNLIWQIIGGLVLLIEYFSEFVPPKYAWIVVGAIYLKQFGLGLKAHSSNPDGTPAEQAYDTTGNGMILPRKGGDDGFLG